MHMSWLRHVGGKLKSDYRYSIGLVYNTFPLPEVEQKVLDSIEPLANAVLEERAKHTEATLSDLYDPDLMPDGLRRAHKRLDAAIDRLYRKSGFAAERERAEHLLGLYENLVSS